MWFTAKWCGPCVRITPKVEELSKLHPTVKVFQIDIDKPPTSDILQNNSISRVPTFKFYKKGSNTATLQEADQVEFEKNMKVIAS